MVTGERSYEEQTRRRLSEAKTQAHELEVKKDEIQKQYAILLRQISAYETILEGYIADTKVNWAILLKELTHKGKLIAIAKHNGGQIGQAQATDIIFGNKLTDAKKRTTVYQMVKNGFDLLTESGTFVKIEPGKYQLVEAQSKLPSVS